MSAAVTGSHAIAPAAKANAASRARKARIIRIPITAPRGNGKRLHWAVSRRSSFQSKSIKSGRSGADPIADLRIGLTPPNGAATKTGMRCFHVMVHGCMDNLGLKHEQSQQEGFVVNRWVGATSGPAAALRAFAKVRLDLLRKGIDPETVTLSVEEMSVAPWLAIFQRTQGFVFYKGND